MSNNVIDTILRRRSSRQYLDTQLDESQLSEIIESGRAAPSGGNSRTTHFIVICNKTAIAHLARLAKNAFSKMEADESTYKSLRSAIERSKKEGEYIFSYNAPTLILTSNKSGYGNAMADSACALENMMIAATSLDIGSCWINQIHWLTDEPTMREYLLSLGLAEDEFITGGLALGYIPSPPASQRLSSGNPVTYVR